MVQLQTKTGVLISGGGLATASLNSSDSIFWIKVFPENPTLNDWTFQVSNATVGAERLEALFATPEDNPELFQDLDVEVVQTFVYTATDVSWGALWEDNAMSPIPTVSDSGADNSAILSCVRIQGDLARQQIISIYELYINQLIARGSTIESAEATITAITNKGRMLNELSRINIMLAEYFLKLKIREKGQYIDHELYVNDGYRSGRSDHERPISGVGDPCEIETVEAERDNIDDSTVSGFDQQAIENIAWLEFDKVKTFYEKRTKDGLYDFTATWDGQGQYQEDRTINYGALFKINKVLVSSPLASRKLMEVELIETQDWAAYNPTEDKNNFIALADDFALEYEATMAAPPSDDNQFFGGGDGYTFDLLLTSLRTIPNTILSIFQGFFLALPLLILLWGAFFGVKITVGLGQKWVGKIGST